MLARAGCMHLGHVSHAPVCLCFERLECCQSVWVVASVQMSVMWRIHVFLVCILQCSVCITSPDLITAQPFTSGVHEYKWGVRQQSSSGGL